MKNGWLLEVKLEVIKRRVTEKYIEAEVEDDNKKVKVKNGLKMNQIMIDIILH